MTLRNVTASPKRAIGLVGIAIAALGGAFVVLLAAGRPLYLDDCDARWQSSMNLFEITMAIHNYADQNDGHFPPAVVTDKAGRPLYSWRVAILPYTVDYVALYREFHLDEPWDSENNRKLLGKMPRIFRPPSVRPSDGHETTFYQAFVGPGTAFERPGLTWKDLADGAGKTFLVVEAAEEVPWTKPGDLAYDPNSALPKLGGRFTAPEHVIQRRGYCYRPVFGVSLCDGSCRTLPASMPEKTLRQWIVRDTGPKTNLP